MTSKVKMVLLGEQSVGKTSIVSKFCKDDFNRYCESTIGAAFTSHPYILKDGGSVMLEIWDTAGQERYEAIAPMYYRGSSAAIVVYDITAHRSLVRAKKWVKTLRRDLGTSTVIVLVGNKCDLESEREVRTVEGQSYSDDMDLQFFECSAKTGRNIDEIFQKIADLVGESDLLMRYGDDSDDPDRSHVVNITAPTAGDAKTGCAGCLQS